MRRGHFCWCCGRVRPNERFSGRNHPRHLCRECAHLPAEEREYRQGERDIERLLHDGLYVPRKRRAQFNRFLAHPNARVRDLARRILAEQRRHAEESRRMRDEDEALAEALGPTLSESREARCQASDHGRTTTRERDRAQDQHRHQ
jgi:hypothetical protein